MVELEQYQRELLARLYSRGVGPPPAPLCAAGASPARVALALEIHRRNLLLGVCRAMAAAYPLCRDLLGNANFKFLCKQYLHEHPSHAHDLGGVGARFADFLATRGEVREHPFLADVARLEWLCDRAVRLAREPYARKVLRLTTRCTVGELWSDHRRGGIDAVRIETVRACRERLAVWSERGEPRVATWSSDVHAALAARRERAHEMSS